MLGLRDFPKASPKRVFEADAGLVSINDNGTLDDLRFHGRPPDTCNPFGDVRFIPDSGLSEREMSTHTHILILVSLGILNHVQAGLLKRSNGFSD